ncbi:hypothetical protein F2P56_009372 [Juglans regia]|uniref:Uncharacterized protein LOC108993379 isoform X1 n=3 Tax=Juglans regia TaxID=51240 RepID=A0A2I4EWP4_JUGRE|nr:uncharacterized protein LOC108993379 isoform X1 [Juglans regia]XP_018823816.1 uncharacterized protein LOC108993379 isoform X1 [Juglans regia]KAF5472678.1 hypothetical protein F2P56_009372 [Juglans regia]
MSVDNHSFVEWEERFVCHERGNRVIHFYLKDVSGGSLLAVVGTERSVRHMTYVVSDAFMALPGFEKSVNACTKWRARREVVEWLTSLVSRHRVPYSDISNSPMIDSRQALGSFEVSMTGFCTRQTYVPDHMVARKLRVQDSEIVWSGVAWICAKQLKHYPAFCRNKTTIAIHSFVFIMGEEGNRYLGYLEDMYEDRKGLKKVKVRWFHHNKEVKGVIPQLNPHPREVFITPHVQVISAECVDGPAIVLTPKHYEKCMAAVAPGSSSGIHVCFRQFKNNMIKPFTLPKLHGYSNQAILSSIDGFLVSKQKLKRHTLHIEDEEELAHDDPLRMGTKRNRSYNGHQGLETGSSGARNSFPGNQITKCEPELPKLKLIFSRKTMGKKIVESQCPLSFMVDDKIELLCQDSGIRGCWFRCKVLRASQKHLKVQYDDVQDADGYGNLEEWVPAARVAAPDKFSMRCSGRLTIRPSPPEDLICCKFEVGTAVDAWWNDGWWEGVIIGVDASGNDTLHVYIPGEHKCLKLQREDFRTSRDWVENKWVDIKGKPDILCCLSENVCPGLKPAVASAMTEASGCGTTLLEAKVYTIPNLETVGEHQQEVPDLTISDDLQGKMKRIDLTRRLCEDENGNNNANGDVKENNKAKGEGDLDSAN